VALSLHKCMFATGLAVFAAAPAAQHVSLVQCTGITADKPRYIKEEVG